jgi:hypothetical protein
MDEPLSNLDALGVPDTTPEFADETQLARHLEGNRK